MPGRSSSFPFLRLLVSAACLAGCAGGPGAGGGRNRSAKVTEVSGVTLVDGALCVVDDSVPNTYFRVRIPPGAGPLIALNDYPIEAVQLPFGNWVDLESIACLADGRIVVLSERLHGIVGEHGPVAEYDYPLTEFGRRGLEGLAVRRLADGSSRVAVLWEGGYPERGSMHPQLEESVGERPLRPVLFVHDVPAGADVGRVLWNEGLARALLEVPVPEGVEPQAQRFRAPDLAWYRWPPAERQAEEWGLLVLLSSQNGDTPRRFLHHWIQRFTIDGRRVGEPLDLGRVAPPALAAANWEGICWWEEGKSVVLVHEGDGDAPPHAFTCDLPAEWQYRP